MKKKNANFNKLDQKNYFGLANYFFGKFGNIPAWLSLQWDSVHVSLKRVKENCFFWLGASSIQVSIYHFFFFFLFFYIPNEKNCTLSSGQVVLIIQRSFEAKSLSFKNVLFVLFTWMGQGPGVKYRRNRAI